MRYHYDELAARPAGGEDIKRVRCAIEALPVRCADGTLWDVDRDSLERMGDMVAEWPCGETVEWRLANNVEQTVTHAELRDYLEEIRREKTRRAVEVFQEYRALRESPGVTLRDLEDWRGRY